MPDIAYELEDDDTSVEDKERVIVSTEQIPRVATRKFTLQQKILEIASHRIKIANLIAEIKQLEIALGLDTETDIDKL